MALDRPRLGLTVLRICVGAFFIFEGLGKLSWFTDTSILSGQLGAWTQAAPATSISHMYLQRVAVPGVAIFARLVPLGELFCGAAMLIGAWTPFFAFVAFFMVMNFHIASGALFTSSFLTNGYGLPVLGSTLALALAGEAKPKIPKVKPSRP